jgi:hypothetical protein
MLHAWHGSPPAPGTAAAAGYRSSYCIFVVHPAPLLVFVYCAVLCQYRAVPWHAKPVSCAAVPRCADIHTVHAVLR